MKKTTASRDGSQPGIGSPPGKAFRPNMRDAQPDKPSPYVNGVQMVQDFGGEDRGYWKGRDVGARADRIAPYEKGGTPSNEEPMTPVQPGIRSPQ